MPKLEVGGVGPGSLARDRQERIDAVVAEFGGGAAAMAAEILRHRDAVARLEHAIGFAKAGAPFGVIAPEPQRAAVERIAAQSDKIRPTKSNTRSAPCT